MFIEIKSENQKIEKELHEYFEILKPQQTLNKIKCKNERFINRAIVEHLNNASIIYLYSMGYRGEDLLNFKIKIHDKFPKLKLVN